ncbi:hypothetical protein F5Y15DRAFT_416078 [Xylariaceae sp. FL0016]|nr:hypothetical protein F5Y15DRAFT_416078 [Xylariaceae sp. FL0016]
MHVPTLLSLLTASTVSATFTLLTPPSIGTTDETEITAPCGGFTVTDSSTFTDWPFLGHDVQVGSITDSSSLFYFNVALLSDPNNFVTLSPNVPTSRKGTWCFQKIRGKTDANWLGQKAIFQLKQYAGDGVYHYQTGYDSAPQFALLREIPPPPYATPN